MRINTKVLLLFIITFFIFIGGFIFVWEKQEENLYTIQMENETEHQKIFTQIVALKSSPLKSFVADNTYWDEMVSFVHTKDPIWAEINIIGSFDAQKHNYAAVYDQDDKLIFYHQSSNDLPSIKTLIPTSSRPQEKPLFSNYYLLAGTHIVEIISAPIQPSKDIHRQSRPQGYYVVGKVLTADAIKDMGKITGHEITLFYVPPKNPSQYDFIHPLKSFTGKEVAYFAAKGIYSTLNTVNHIIRLQLYAMIIIGLFSLIAVLFSIYRIIIKPLTILSQTIRMNDVSLLSKLLFQRDELGDIAKAIEHNIATKDLLEKLSITDGLTNIYNRRYFDTVFPKIITSAKRNNDLVCFLLMDIDHFKQYNDHYGHQAGDKALINFAAVLSNSIGRADDYCFRLGGEEFGILFKAEREKNALEFADTVREKIVALKILHEYSSTSSVLTTSMGLACNRAKTIADENAIYKQADDLLYKAKENGRNQVCSNICLSFELKKSFRNKSL